MKRRPASSKKISTRSQVDRPTQERATAFLARAVPDELKPHYVPDSLAEVAIRVVASGEMPESELLELVEMSVGEYEAEIAGAGTADLRAYFEECRALLEQILAAGRQS